MENSFYDLDYIIGMGEKRVDLYLSAYRGVLGQLTNIILIYSAIGIYLIPIIQDIIDGANTKPSSGNESKRFCGQKLLTP